MVMANEKPLSDRIYDPPLNLITGKFCRCAQNKGYWFSSQNDIKEGDNTYRRLVGTCKGCNNPVEKIHLLDSAPA